MKFDAATEFFGGLSGRTITGARPGIGSFLSIDLQSDHEEIFWLQNAAWRIVGADGVIAGSSDEPDVLNRGAHLLSGAIIQSASVDQLCDVTFHLSNGLCVSSFTTIGLSDVILWSLFLKDEVLSGVSGMIFEIESRR